MSCVADIPELHGMREGPESCIHCTSPTPDLMLLKIFMILKQGTSHYHFAQSLSNHVADSASLTNPVVLFLNF